VSNPEPKGRLDCFVARAPRNDELGRDRINAPPRTADIEIGFTPSKIYSLKPRQNAPVTRRNDDAVQSTTDGIVVDAPLRRTRRSPQSIGR
jgi:hypothetical protein